MIDLYEPRGVTSAQVAQRFGIGVSSVKRVLRDHGMHPAPSTSRRLSGNRWLAGTRVTLPPGRHVYQAAAGCGARRPARDTRGASDRAWWLFTTSQHSNLQ